MKVPFPSPKELLSKHGLFAKKSWGQNFLISERVYRAIVDASVAESGDWVVEFGAGLGTLTMRLAERVPEGKVFCVERDRELVAVLEAELGHLENVEVVPGNALTYDLKTVARAQGEPICVCGNLPYQIASRILVNTIDCGVDVVSKAVFMVQREVADRLLASPGTKQYGLLSVIVQTVAVVEKVVQAPPGAFLPPPKVSSTVVRLRLLPAEKREEIVDFSGHRAVVKAAFSQRRKRLSNSLTSAFSKTAIVASLAEAGIDGARRAETLTVKEFARLSNSFSRLERDGA